MGALTLNVADVDRFLGHNVAAVGQRSSASEKNQGTQCSRVFTDQERPDLDGPSRRTRTFPKIA
jgi:hypothetical protein